MKIKELTIEEQTHIDGGGWWDVVIYSGRGYLRQKRREVEAGIKGAITGRAFGGAGGIVGAATGVMGAKIDGIFKGFANVGKHAKNIRKMRKKYRKYSGSW